VYQPNRLKDSIALRVLVVSIAGLGMETAVGVGETAVGESVGTVGAETMAEFSSAFGETRIG
jgi:hypothetical protein